MEEGRRRNARAGPPMRLAAVALLGTAAVLSALLTASLRADAQFDVVVHSDVVLTATDSSFIAGECLSLNNAIAWNASANWEITVRSLNADLGQSNDGFYTKPLSDLQWKLSSQSSWNAMTTSDVQVTTGAAGSSSFDVDYRFLLSWALDRPGTYGATIQYTITAL